MAFLELTEICKSYGERDVLRHLKLSLDEGEFVSIVGASASGKTTLLKIAAGLIDSSAGDARIGGEPLTGFPQGASIVFQNYSLLPWLTALQNVLLAVESTFPQWSETKQRDQATK